MQGLQTVLQEDEARSPRTREEEGSQGMDSKEYDCKAGTARPQKSFLTMITTTFQAAVRANGFRALAMF